MEVGESVTVGRKRTDSNGASSDSELSDGWNFVDHIQDLPSSDGESVEVIEPDNESLGGTDGEAEPEGVKSEECKEVATKAACPVVEADSPRRVRQVPPPPTASPPQHPPEREEMFDSSFCRFLFFATSAVLVSNLAYMAAENSFVWNMDVGIDSPSFLRDLPTTPKQKHQGKFPNIIPWANNEEATVETAEDSITEVKLDKVTDGIKQNINYQTMLEDFRPKETLKIYNYEVGKFFKSLSETTDSVDIQDKFAQALLILDAMQIGLKDLEEVVTENTELHRVLENQKRKLSDVLREVEFGVSKSMERLAINVLNKVQHLERKFENQWCVLEKHGHKEELRGLFYDCQEHEEKQSKNYKSYKKDFDKEGKSHNKYNDKDDDKHWKYGEGDKQLDADKKRYDNLVSKDSFGSYEVDEDITGKVFSKSSSNEKNSEEYYDLVHKKHDKHSKSHDYDHAKNGFKDNYDQHKEKKYDYKFNNGYDYEHTQFDFKEKRNDQYKDKKYDDHKMKKESFGEKKENNHDFDNTKKEFRDKNDYDKDRKYNNDMLKKQGYSDKKDSNHKDDKVTYSEKKHDYKEEKHSTDKYKHLPHSNSYKTYNENNSKEKYDRSTDKSGVDKSAIETLVKILKEKCDSESGSKHRGENPNDYHKFKSKIDEKLRIPKKLFDDLYEKYCKNGNKYKHNNKYVKDNVENNYKQNGKTFSKGEARVIHDENHNVMTVNVEVIAPPKDNYAESPEAATEIVIPPANEPRQWIISHGDLSTDNKSDVNGDWFLKNGEFRSNVRWSHHRGDWWFDRASSRRGHAHNSAGGLPGRHKNWFFRRAWARQQCRQSPHGSWCTLADDETITLPPQPPPTGPSSKQR